jgi:hypothetical protein
MPRLTPSELYLANLRGEFSPGSLSFMSKEEARAELNSMTGQDFGMNTAKWEAWLTEHPPVIAVKAASPAEALKLVRKLKKS